SIEEHRQRPLHFGDFGKALPHNALLARGYQIHSPVTRVNAPSPCGLTPPPPDSSPSSAPDRSRHRPAPPATLPGCDSTSPLPPAALRSISPKRPEAAPLPSCPRA